MKKIFFLILLLPLLFANRCVTKEMRKNTISIDNKLGEEVFLLPYKIKYDFYDIKDTKAGIMSNYAISPLSQKKIFYTPFCIKDYWDRTVIGDTLEILVFVRDTLEKDKDLEELVSDKSYIRKIKLTYDKLTADSCRVVID
jgi:hypothetical protein